jgi:hypothetical protein
MNSWPTRCASVITRNVRWAALSGVAVVDAGVGGVVVGVGRGETCGGADVVGVSDVVGGGIGVADLLDEHPATATTVIAIAATATFIRQLLQSRRCDLSGARAGPPGERTLRQCREGVV